jgi:Galactoside-binding lectin
MASIHLIPVNSAVPLSHPISADGIVIFRSPQLDLLASPSRTALNLLAQNGDIVLHIGFRHDQNLIVFNAFHNNWLSQESIPFGTRLNGQNHTITVIDHGDRYQIAFNGITGYYFKKQINAPATSLQYVVDAGHKSLFSIPVVGEAYTNLAALLPGLN